MYMGRQLVALLLVPMVAAAAQEPERVRILAHDYAFEVPGQVTSGAVRFVLVGGEGADYHHAQIVRFEAGRTLDDLMSAMADGDGHGLPDWAHAVGGPGAVAAGDSSEATLNLEPGLHAVICTIPTVRAQGRPHVMLGMAREFEVTAATGRAEHDWPHPDVEIALVDYGFSIPGPLKAGKQVIRIVNEGDQWHEIVFIQLSPGTTPQDFLAWLATEEGPPPARLRGGTTGLDVGEFNDIALDLEPGRYLLICFLPDHADGAPHLAHGMMTEIEVR